jgi:DNA-binding NarL/FixJ family response regulator
MTAREREILVLLAQGRPNKVIARQLNIAEQTVKNHLSRIFQALGVTDRTQAALPTSKRNGCTPTLGAHARAAAGPDFGMR